MVILRKDLFIQANHSTWATLPLFLPHSYTSKDTTVFPTSVHWGAVVARLCSLLAGQELWPLGWDFHYYCHSQIARRRIEVKGNGLDWGRRRRIRDNRHSSLAANTGCGLLYFVINGPPGSLPGGLRWFLAKSQSAFSRSGNKCDGL